MMDVRPLLRPLARVPRQTLVTGLLKHMLDERRHMVLVADERGRTVGLLTLEDLVEELVGEIESDTELPPPTRPTASPAHTLGGEGGPATARGQGHATEHANRRRLFGLTVPTG